jgi:hypothetical protein
MIWHDGKKPAEALMMTMNAETIAISAAKRLGWLR